MENEFAKHETDYIKKYEQLGYTDSYRLVKKSLKSLHTEKVYAPDEITIVKEHRYEGMSNPSDMSLLNVLKTKNGEKGTFLQAYGPSSEGEVASFFNEIPEENISDKANLNL